MSNELTKAMFMVNACPEGVRSSSLPSRWVHSSVVDKRVQTPG